MMSGLRIILAYSHLKKMHKSRLGILAALKKKNKKKRNNKNKKKKKKKKNKKKKNKNKKKNKKRKRRRRKEDEEKGEEPHVAPKLPREWFGHNGMSQTARQQGCNEVPAC